MRRLLFALLLATIGVIGFGVVAEAHALLRSSAPADGATLDRPPSEVSLTFTEPPDPRLSIIHVYNSGGQRLERGVRPVTGDRDTLTVAVPGLSNGVYTVSWTTVSALDGHYASGSFAFGVGTSPLGASLPAGTAVRSTTAPSPLGVTAGWLYYVGLALLLGGTWISLFALRQPSRRLLVMATAGVGAALLGLLGAAESQREAADASWAAFFSTSLGGNLLKQLIPVALAAVALLVARTSRRRVAWLAAWLAGGLTLVAIFTHALTTHAGASHLAWLMVPAQWAHLTAFAVWIGGLAALLVGVRGLPAAVAARAVRRFSFMAGFALAAIGITGLLRAIDEVGVLSRLTSTLFGGLVLVKVALFLALASLGAINRYRNVPRAEWTLRGLLRVGRFEIGIAALVIGVAAVLTSLAPPSYTQVAAAGQPQQIVARGQDLGTTVKVQLVVTPGYPGSNHFTLSVRDYDTGKPVSANQAALRFDFPGRPAIGESTLALRKVGSGSYAATGTNLSLAGRWSVTATIENGLQSAEVPLTVTTAIPPERISVLHEPGVPDIYTVTFAAGRSLQLYVDPGTRGFNAVHATFFNGNNELPMADGTVISATPATGPTVDLPVTRFDTIGHFIGQGPLSAGTWRFDVTASSSDGQTYQASFQETIK
ncbi:MAG TPA: copper resistance protein CopC [Candidatus Dormibacteraeota bacterium]|nr:copper resistance protein CopC [Candidatus Dormibacteraeota bacterium]